MPGYGFKKIPPDVFKFVVEEQNKIKKERGTNKISFETVVYKMLREYKRCREENPNFKPQ